MKTPLSIAIAASLTLSGCALFHRSPTWDAVVKSRAHYSDAAAASAKDGYLQHLHRVLSDAGVEHKIVTYEIHFHNVYHEAAVQTAVAILYRDDTTPRDPWWAMDEYHNVPVWLPSWALDAQLEFFIKRDVKVLAVKEYAGGGAHEPRVSGMPRSLHRLIASVPKPRKQQRTPLVVGITKSHAKAPATQPSADPLTALTLGGHSAQTSDPHADSLFRSAHGTAFDPGSSVDRQKMDELKRRLLNRNRSVQLRTE